jgi:hypothetical protein
MLNARPWLARIGHIYSPLGLKRLDALDFRRKDKFIVARISLLIWCTVHKYAPLGTRTRPHFYLEWDLIGCETGDKIKISHCPELPSAISIGPDLST